MTRHVVTRAACLTLAAALSACGTRTFTPTYVNIPPERGDMAWSDPNARDIRQIVVAAVQRAVRDESMEGPYELRLPAESTPETYAVVTSQLGGDALVPSDVPTVQLDDKGNAIEGTQTTPTPGATLGAFPTLEVRSIRIRSGKGQVDIVRPSVSGRGLTTVYMDWEAGFGWAAERSRAWRVDPDAQPLPVGPRPDSDGSTTAPEDQAPVETSLPSE